jgi:hypothetical protein
MKLKIKLLLLFILSCALAEAQKVQTSLPNFNQIKHEIEDKASDCYYPSIFQRFNANDTTLTNDQYRCLYYGYTFQKEYRPYLRLPQDSLLASYAKKVNKTHADCDSIIRFATQSLAIFPLDIYKINQLSYAYHLIGRNDLARIYGHKAARLAATIFSTGNGRTQPTAWYVISVSDEYEIIYLLGLFPVDQRFVYSDCDYVSVAKNNMYVKGFYFNVKRLLDVGPTIRDAAHSK